MAKAKTSYVTGEKGRNRVRVFADSKTGIFLLEFYEQALGTDGAKRKTVSTGHRDWDRAKRQADEMAARITRNEPAPSTGLTLRTLFDIYLKERTPEKSPNKRKHDHRCAEMFLRYFGTNRKPLTLARRDFDRYVRDRRAGKIAPLHASKPNEGEEKRPHTVGACIVGHDLRWLNAVFNWATIAGDGKGGVLLVRNPFKGFPIPREESPRRPIVSEEQYQALRKVASEVDPLFALVLTLAHETGHRVGSIRLLRWSDIDLEAKRIHWRGENDKIRFDHVTTLTDDAVEALNEARRSQAAIGDAWVFPAPRLENGSIPRRTLIKWWAKAETLAQLPPEKGRGYHSLRRKFATELKSVPIRDLAYLGGWKCPQTVLTVYQRADEGTMREALASRKALRAAAN